MKNVKSDFPIFTTFPNLVYLDSAATSQKPQAVIDAVRDFYTKKNANIHRGIYALAEKATEVYENTRMQVGEFINAKSSNEIIFTSNTNHAINQVAYGWARKNLSNGDIIVLSEMEHHGNIVPWIRLKEEKGVELVFLPIDEDYRLDYTKLIKGLDTEKIKLVALAHASNTLGTVNPLDKIIPFFKKYTQAKILIDAAQSVPHMRINVQKLGADFVIFSSHKMLGPSGVGVLWTKEELLESMDPLLVGSHMISTVTKEKATWADIPHRFEVGTGALEGVAGLSAAVSYLNAVGMENIEKYESELTEYALDRFKEIPYVKLYGPEENKNRLGIFSFGIEGSHPHDIAQILDRNTIAVRSGHHCAQITMEVLGVPATARASLYLYNTEEDIDRLLEGIKEVKKTLKI